MINVIKRKLNHIFHPTEDTYIGNKKRIRLENTRRVCFNRKEYFENWDRILNGLDHRTKLIRISDTKLNTRKKLIEKIKSM